MVMSSKKSLNHLHKEQVMEMQAIHAELLEFYTRIAHMSDVALSRAYERELDIWADVCADYADAGEYQPMEPLVLREMRTACIMRLRS